MSDLRDIATLCKEIDYLTSQVDTLRTERDEARCEVCYREHELRENSVCKCSPLNYAERMGWDCFKSDTLSQEVSQEGEQ
jgi:hypothetical protein